MQFVNCDVFKPPARCEITVLTHWTTVKRMSCMWDKGRLQWMSKQRTECCYSRRVNIYVSL